MISDSHQPSVEMYIEDSPTGNVVVHARGPDRTNSMTRTPPQGPDIGKDGRARREPQIRHASQDAPNTAIARVSWLASNGENFSVSRLDTP